jgi:ABC-2 type transport system ATP-binding protein
LPTSGRAYVGSDDSSSVEARRHIGWLPETPPLTGELTVEEQLTFAARLRSVPSDDIARVVSQCDLSDVRKSLISTLSKGTKQRVGLAQALLGNPAVLLLDEPTAGLDPTQAASFRALIRSLASERAVLLSTHLLHDVGALCSRAVLLRNGTVVADVKLDELRAKGSFEEAIVGLLA